MNRREFLKATATALAWLGLGAPGVQAAEAVEADDEAECRGDKIVAFDSPMWDDIHFEQECKEFTGWPGVYETIIPDNLCTGDSLTISWDGMLVKAAGPGDLVIGTALCDSDEVGHVKFTCYHDPLEVS